jgi:hypothetical protein
MHTVDAPGDENNVQRGDGAIATRTGDPWRLVLVGRADL